MVTNEEKILFELHRSGSGVLEERFLHTHHIPQKELAKSFDDLRELGFVIEKHPQRGHRLMESPDSLIPDDLHARLRAVHPSESFLIGNRIVVFQKTESTNDVVQKLSSQGHPEGLVVFAESQTAGRGRHARSWISPAGKGLWFTILLRPTLPMHSMPRVTVMTAVAVAQSLRRMTRLPLRIKWPNDILCQGKKLAGILIDLSANSGRIQSVAIGIGINVHLEENDFPVELREVATSLKLEAGRSFHRPSLCADLLSELERWSPSVNDADFPKLLDAWSELDETVGTQVCVHSAGKPPLRGLALSLDTDGALLVRTDSGQIEKVIAGDVTMEKMK